MIHVQHTRTGNVDLGHIVYGFRSPLPTTENILFVPLISEQVKIFLLVVFS